ncbi:type 1 glutamine amidotransferase [Corynebacterium coyleae]|uniref:type 1 glutamine amidotransferase n=1 Tax=Corynebacterium coyleae TaxID=53374 RepID=UPI002549ECFF|nr:glutamine amidotransferase [Corynebacterium coyleae]MDK8663850.1 glutamine amidotransferase [Corynebacterium coyleae]MDK8706805.1 glutamine amidotransferase [Corynebacterium coyleae]MDK8733652.1 glutamine amidotransferase [Corynebacterium coyleae]MDK8892848.1 glutamine amidotransferase [Corynebacterium coyleae]
MPKLTIGLVLPDVLGTYGDDGNALVLRERARLRGFDAHIERFLLHDDIPATCDIYTLGGGEDSAQLIAAARLNASPGLQAAAADGRPVFAVCAGLQVLGHTFRAHGEEVEGVGLLDITTSPLDTRATGELLSEPTQAGITAELTETLTGFENHMGATVLGPEAQALGVVTRGVGNGAGDGASAGAAGTAATTGAKVDGVVQSSVIATYMHGPALARNPQLADLLIARALDVPLAELAPLDLEDVAQLRRERLAK